MLRNILVAAAIFAPTGLSAQDQASAGSVSISQQRQDILAPFLRASDECLALAKAIPEEKYGWRPMDGVRSFGEVFVHMAGGTLLFGSYAGLKPPQGPAHELAATYMKRGFEMPEIFAAERAIRTKAQTIEIMDQAFHQVQDLIRHIPDSDLEKKVNFFGRQATLRGVLIQMGDHLSEHLGQAIAYARVNHIVPPWSQKQ